MVSKALCTLFVFVVITLLFHFQSPSFKPNKGHASKKSRQRGGICIDEYHSVFQNLLNPYTNMAETVRSDHEKQMLKHDDSGCYFVPFETGVSKLEYCKSELSEHGYCVVDIEALGIDFTPMAIIDKRLQRAVHKQMEKRLHEKVFPNDQFDTNPDPEDGTPIFFTFDADNKVHYDNGYSGDVVVWIPLYARKRLMAWSIQDAPPIISASKQAVIFYTKHFKHAGFTATADINDTDEFLLNVDIPEWIESYPFPRSIRLRFDFADHDKA